MSTPQDPIKSCQIHYNPRNTGQVESYYCRANIFNFFFPYAIIE